MAGPRLTPTSFEAGLHHTSFPNPGMGRAPYFQAGITAAGSQGFFGDFALGWWSPTASEYDNRYGNKGAFCFVRRGARWAPSAIPAGDPGYFTAATSICL